MKTFWIRILSKYFSTKRAKKPDPIMNGLVYQWHAVPFLRMIIPLLVGILLAGLYPIDFGWGLALLIFTLFIFLLGLLKWKESANYSYRYFTGIIIYVFLFLLGNVLVHINQGINHPMHYATTIKLESPRALMMLEEPPEERSKTYRAKGELISVYQRGEWKKTKGKILLYMEKCERVSKLSYGDVISFKLKPQKTTPTKNPYEFDYADLLQRNNIYHTQYLKIGSWHETGKNMGKFIYRLSYYLKKQIFDIFNIYVPDKRQSGVAAALIFGYKEELDPDLVAAYSHTGTLHVLAVSGLHVGIVYAVLGMLLSFLNASSKQKLIKLSITILLLWFYALLTGFSPSVLRAALMFSFVAIGEGLKRQVNIYNSIMASAFILLLINPFLIYDIGFQLSYAAVIGIIYLQPRMARLYAPKNWLVGQIWTICSVSIAAQLATMPLGLYYFHQFPNYFLISNLLIIPLSTLITYCGLLLIAVSPIAALANLCGRVLDRLIYFTDNLVFTLDRVPYSTTNNIMLDWSQAFSLAAALLMIVLFVVSKKTYWFWLASAFVLFLLGKEAAKKIEQHSQSEAWIYHLNNTSFVSFISGKQALLLSDTAGFLKTKQYTSKVQPHLLHAGIDEPEEKTYPNMVLSRFVKKYKNIYFFKKYRIAVIDKTDKEPLKIEVDYLLLKNSPPVHIKNLVANASARMIVVDGSNKPWLQKRWKKEAAQLRQCIYFTAEGGALRID